MTDSPPPDISRQACPRCNSPVEPGKMFCESCGAKIDTPLRCIQCGAPVNKAMKFCESCGAPCEVVPEYNVPAAPEVIAEQAPALKKSEEPGHTPPSLPLSEHPVAKKTVPSMKWVITSLVILIIVAIAVIAFALPMLSGTTASDKSGGNSPGTVSGTAPGTTPTTGSSLVTGTLTPGPTQVPPPNLDVKFQAERDPISNIVTVTFTGGAGQNGVREVLVRLTRSDGQVITKTFTIPQIGISETLQGTKMTDRVEVSVSYYNGERYTVLDETFEYKKR